MATSEILTTEDIDHLSTAIQLNPHQKSTEFTTVTKTEDGDLVPLDELYEKTGQESIEKIIAGAESLLKRNKLTREQGLLLKVAGAESWLDLPDRMNAVKGGEGFIDKLAAGFIELIKKIIAFIKGVCVWIYRRIKTLFGFSKTNKERMFLYRQIRKAKESVIGLYKILGIDIDYAQLAEELKEAKVQKEFIEEVGFDPQTAFLIAVRDANVSAETALEGISDLVEKLKSLIDVIYAGDSALKTGFSIYNKIMDDIRILLRNGQILTLNIKDLKFNIAKISKDYLDPGDYIGPVEETLSKLAKLKNPVGLGEKARFDAVKNKLSQAQKKLRVSFNAELYNRLNVALETYTEYEREGLNTKLDPDIANKLKDFVKDADGVLIKQIADQTNDPELYEVFLAFTKNVSTYSTALETSYAVVMEAEAMIASQANNMNKLNLAINAILTKDIKSVLGTDLNLTLDNATKIVGTPDSLFSFSSIQGRFLKLYPDQKVPTMIKNEIQGFFSTVPGKKFMDIIRSHITQFQRNR